MAANAIDIKNLSVVYDRGAQETRAVDHFSLEIQEKEIFALLGPNGAGKSSIISSLTGLLRIEHGSVRIFGHDAGSLGAKALTGVVPQELVHHGYFTVNEILNFFSGYYGIANNQKYIDYLLDRLALFDKKHKKVSQLSGGMKRRLLIAKALVHSPKLLLLDEPSAGVDIELRRLLWEFVLELNQKGTTILLTTHYLEEAQRLCDRVAIMNNGKLLAVDNTGKMIASMADRVIRLRLKTDFKGSVGRLSSELEVVGAQGNNLQLKSSGSLSLKEVLDSLQIEISDVDDIQMEQGALEDAFIRILNDSKGEITAA